MAGDSLPMAPASPLRRITGAILIAAIAVLIAWDVYAAVAATDATISAVVTSLSLAHPIIPFAVGVVAGHWFWRS